MMQPIWRSSLAAAAVSWLSAQAGRTAQPVSIVAYVGSTACDGQDKGCHDHKDEQEIVHALEVDEDGSLVPLPRYLVKADGMPAWFAGDARCMFITRPDRSDILALPVGPSATLKAPGKEMTSGGINPVHAAVMDVGGKKWLLVANYNGPDSDDGASVSLYQVGDGCNLTHTDTAVHRGSSVDRSRQNGAHVHSINPGRNGLVYACDLGTDKVVTYRVNPQAGTLEKLADFAVTPGHGPRHAVLHPTLNVLYVVCEMSPAVLVLAVDEQTGGLELKQEVSVLAAGESAEGSKAAEILLSPDGSTLYASCRGRHNTVVAWRVGADGALEEEVLQRVEAPAYPRGMTLVHDGSVMLVAGQSSNEVVSFVVESGGKLAKKQTITQGEGIPPNPGAFGILTTIGMPPSLLWS